MGIRSRSTPEQPVGSLATRTPESQSYPNLHHATILRAELAGHFDLRSVHGRVILAGGQRVQLGDKKGVVFAPSPEAEALSRWGKREFLDCILLHASDGSVSVRSGLQGLRGWFHPDLRANCLLVLREHGWSSVTVGTKFLFFKNCVEQVTRPFRKQEVGESGHVPLTVGQ